MHFQPDLITEVLETSEEFVLPGDTALTEVVVTGVAAEPGPPVTAQSGPRTGAHTAPGPRAAPELGTAGWPESQLALTETQVSTSLVSQRVLIVCFRLDIGIRIIQAEKDHFQKEEKEAL